MAKTKTKPAPLTNDRLLSTTEVASLLNMSDESIRRFIHQGRLPFVRLGRSYRVRMSVLERFIEQNTIGGR